MDMDSDMNPDMEPADMEPGDMEAADMEAADMEAADMEAADTEPVDMEPGDMEPVDMEQADMEPADMKPADMKPDMNPDMQLAEYNPAEQAAIGVDTGDLDDSYNDWPKEPYTEDNVTHVFIESFIDDLGHSEKNIYDPEVARNLTLDEIHVIRNARKRLVEKNKLLPKRYRDITDGLVLSLSKGPFIIPDVVKGTTTKQNIDAQRILLDFITDVQLDNAKNKTLLVIGCRNGDFLMEYLLPILPPNIKEIDACDLTEVIVNKARERHSDHPGHTTRKINFKKMDLHADTFEVSKKYDCIISVWGIRWFVDKIPNYYCHRLMTLLNSFGHLAVLFDSYHYYYFAIDQVGYEDKWLPRLSPILAGMPRGYRIMDSTNELWMSLQKRMIEQIIAYCPLTLPAVLNRRTMGIAGVSAPARRTDIAAVFTRREIVVDEVPSPSHLRDQMEEQYRFTDFIPRADLDEFYREIYENMLDYKYHCPSPDWIRKDLENGEYSYSYDRYLVGYSLQI